VKSYGDLLKTSLIFCSLIGSFSWVRSRRHHISVAQSKTKTFHLWMVPWDSTSLDSLSMVANRMNMRAPLNWERRWLNINSDHMYPSWCQAVISPWSSLQCSGAGKRLWSRPVRSTHIMHCPIHTSRSRSAVSVSQRSQRFKNHKMERCYMDLS